MEGKAKKNIIVDNRKSKELISISLISIFSHPLFIYIILESVAGGGGFDFGNFFFFFFWVNFLLVTSHQPFSSQKKQCCELQNSQEPIQNI